MSSDVVAAPERSEPALSHLQGSFLVLVTAVFFSFGGLAFRSTDDISAWEYLFFRGAGMALATFAVFLVKNRELVTKLADRPQPSHFLAGVVLGAMNCLFIVSLEFATVAFVLFTQTLAPIAAAYFSWLILRERASSRVVVATAFSMAGVAIMVAGTVTEDLSASALLALLIPVGFGLYATIIRSADRIDPSFPIIIAGLTLLVLSTAVVMAQGGFDSSLRDALIGLFAGSVLLGFPLAVFNTAQRVVPSPETALLLLGEVVLAPIWVWVFVDERPAESTLLGGSVILAAVLWLTLRRPPRAGRPITSRG